MMISGKGREAGKNRPGGNRAFYQARYFRLLCQEDVQASKPRGQKRGSYGAKQDSNLAATQYSALKVKVARSCSSRFQR